MMMQNDQHQKLRPKHQYNEITGLSETQNTYTPLFFSFFAIDSNQKWCQLCHAVCVHQYMHTQVCTPRLYNKYLHLLMGFEKDNTCFALSSSSISSGRQVLTCCKTIKTNSHQRYNARGYSSHHHCHHTHYGNVS